MTNTITKQQGTGRYAQQPVFNLLAKSLDLHIRPGQDTTQFLYHACCLEEVFGACCNIPQQVSLYNVLQCKQMLAGQE